MNSWNAMTYDGRDNLVRVVRQEARRFFELVTPTETWEQPTACANWQVRDVVGHLVDTTESYFVAFDAARNHGEVPPAYGLPGMATRVDEKARAFRSVPQAELLEGLGPDEWAGLVVPHFYMGPLPAFFYPVFQLIDYGIHSWDIREGAGRTHALYGETADLLVPFMFVVWQATYSPTPQTTPTELGIRVTSGPNAGDTRMRVSPEGLSYEQGDVSDLSTVIEFDPASFVLTAYGRYNAGTVRGGADTAEHYLSSFFRI